MRETGYILVRLSWRDVPKAHVCPTTAFATVSIVTLRQVNIIAVEIELTRVVDHGKNKSTRHGRFVRNAARPLTNRDANVSSLPVLLVYGYVIVSDMSVAKIGCPLANVQNPAWSGARNPELVSV